MSRIAKCISCGCTDNHACAEGCTWVQVDRKGGVGICSACVAKAVPATVIHFEDHGQDFLRWTLDAKGMVIDSQPFQASIWAGLFVVERKLKAGMRISIVMLTGTRRVNYPLARVQKLKAGA